MDVPRNLNDEQVYTYNVVISIQYIFCQCAPHCSVYLLDWVAKEPIL